MAEPWEDRKEVIWTNGPRVDNGRVSWQRTHCRCGEDGKGHFFTWDGLVDVPS